MCWRGSRKNEKRERGREREDKTNEELLGQGASVVESARTMENIRTDQNVCLLCASLCLILSFALWCVSWCKKGV